MKKIEDEEKENSERWLLTYSDLITLLMIFFIIMYSMSKLDAVKYQNVAQSLNAAMGGGRTMIGTTDSPSAPGDSKPAVVDTYTEQKDQMMKVKGDVDKYIKANNLQNDVVTEMDERGLVIRFKDSILFDTGQANIKSQFAGKIIKIGKILTKVSAYIRVEGHTDNVPIKNYQFNSNWQLSTTRATNVVELLISKSGIKPSRISAVGYGEYRPIASNKTQVGKAKNRRVDIILINSKYDTIEHNSNN